MSVSAIYQFITHFWVEIGYHMHLLMLCRREMNYMGVSSIFTITNQGNICELSY